MPLDWSPDGRILLFQLEDPRSPSQMDLWTYSAADGKATPFLQSASNEILGRKTHLRPPPGGQFDVTPDGERFLVNLRPADEISDPITLVRNWAGERRE